MHQNIKLIIAVIITAAVVSGGVYYWKNSKNQNEPSPESTETPNELPKINRPAEQPINEDSPESPDYNYNQTADWISYTNQGITLKYPADGTYSVETPEVGRFIISQPHPGNRIHVIKTTDISDLPKSSGTKNIVGRTYKQFQRDGLGSGYGYILEQTDSQYYVFESVWGPENEIFELLMTTVKPLTTGVYFDRSKFTTQDLGNNNWQFVPAEVKSLQTKNNTTFLSIDLLKINPDFAPDGTQSFFINPDSATLTLATNSETLSYKCGAGPDEDQTTPDIPTELENILGNIQIVAFEPTYFFDIQNNTITAIYESCLP